MTGKFEPGSETIWREVCGLTAIILTILKWIGIVLLVIIGLVLVVAACLLFVPVRYHLYLEKREELLVKGYASWLFHLLHISFQVKDHGESHVLRILGIPLSGRDEQAKRKRRKRPSAGKAARVTKQKERKGEEGEHKLLAQKETKEMEKESRVSEKQSETEHLPEEGNEIPFSQKSGQKQKNTGNKKFFQKIKEFFLPIRRVLGKIWKGLQSIWKFLREGPEQRNGDSRFAKAKMILTDENTMQLWKLVWKNLSALWKHSKPRKMKGWIHFGTSDPCTTGQILGVIGAGYGFIGSGVQIVPDFEQAVLEGHLEIKGRIRLMVLLLIAKRILWSGQWKHFKKQLDEG